jgi:hypothetical protein
MTQYLEDWEKRWKEMTGLHDNRSGGTSNMNMKP